MTAHSAAFGRPAALVGSQKGVELRGDLAKSILEVIDMLIISLGSFGGKWCILFICGDYLKKAGINSNWGAMPNSFPCPSSVTRL